MVSRLAALTNNRRLTAAVLGLVLASGYLYYFAFKAQLEIDIQGSNEAIIDVFWQQGNLPFVAGKRSLTSFGPEMRRHTMLVGHMGSMDRIRIDPGKRPMDATIKRISITQPGFEPLVLDSPADFAGVTALNDIAGLEVGENALVIRVDGPDGQVGIEINPVRLSGFPLVHLIFCLLAFLVAALLVYSPARLWSLSERVPLLLLIPFCLAVIMASITDYGVHPDERVHMDAVTYYGDNWLPPSIEDPAIAHTFSDYGKSRLSSYEIFYPLAGYITRLLEPLHISGIFSARLFNLALLAGLLLFALARPEFRPFALLLLISSQVWYLFSYVNSDALALTLALVISYQAAYSQSMLNRYLTEPDINHLLARVLVLGGLIGSLLLLKANFLFFLLFLGLYLLWRIFTGDFSDRRLLLKRLSILFCIGLLVPAARYSLDIHANGFDSPQKYQQKIEEKALYIYKPSTPAEERGIYLDMRSRGVGVMAMIVKFKWSANSLLTAFGSFGFTQYNPGLVYYQLLKAMCLVLLVTVAASALFNAPREIGVLFLVTAACALGLVGISLWASWTINFQPQGRYFAPILAMASVLYFHLRPYLYRRCFYSVLGVLFAMGIYSFLFYGLRLIEKTVY